MNNQDQSCITPEGHEWAFVGYMVVAKELPRDGKGPNRRVFSGTCTVWPKIMVPERFEAKIEVWQCSLCGWVQLKPAVFTRL